MKTPLFSTYRQGENRVTSSIIAVLERIGVGRVEQLLTVASDDAVWSGNDQQVFLLSGPDDVDTIRLIAPIRHESKSAWVQGQRYTSSKALTGNPRTTAELQGVRHRHPTSCDFALAMFPPG